MTHIEYDEFGSYEETIDLIPVGTAQNGELSFLRALTYNGEVTTPFDQIQKTDGSFGECARDITWNSRRS